MAAATGASRAPAAQEINRKNRRQFIVSEAAKLFAETGYQAATMDQLSAMTGLNKGTIYYYYKSKSDILFDMSVSITERGLKLVAPALKMAHASDGLAHMIDVVVRWINGHRDAVKTYFQESAYFESIFTAEQHEQLRAQQKTMTRTFYAVLEQGRVSGEFRDVDVTETGRLVVGMIMWLYRWPEQELDCDRIVAAITTLLQNGLARLPVAGPEPGRP